MPKQQQKQNFLHGALILSIAVALVKVIGAVFKIPLQNYILGDEGNAYFTVAYNIYATLFVAATAGLPVAISKMVSEAEALGRHNESRRVFRVALAVFFFIGVTGTSLMIIFSKQIAEFMNRPEANYAIMAIAPSIFFVAIISSFRGYNQGKGNMTPTAVSQVIEALGKLIVGIALSWWILERTGSLIYAAAGAIGGVSFGTVLSALYMMLVTRAKRPEFNDPVPLRSRGTVLGELLKIAIPITISSSILSITNLIDAAQINGLLESAVGFTSLEATKLYGAYGFAQTMFNLPSAFFLPIAVSIIPAIAAAMARGDKRSAGETITTSLKMSMLLALPAAAGLMSLGSPIMKMIYTRQQDAAAVAGPLLSLLSWSIPFVCLVTVTNAILQSLGRVYTPIITMTIGGVIKVAVNYMLVSNPDIHISGAPIGTLACYFIISAVNIGVILTVARPPKLISSFIKPAAAAILMGLAAWGVQVALMPIMGNTISTAIAVVCGVILYVVLVVAFKVLTHNDILLIPKGDKIARFIKK